MPPKAKSKNTPHAHDKRHESGLAAPGKRVTKQRSNGQLNGHPNGKPPSAVTPPPLPSTGLNQGFKFQRSADSPCPPPDVASQLVRKDPAAAAERLGRRRISSDASLEEAAAVSSLNDAADFTPETMHGPHRLDTPTLAHRPSLPSLSAPASSGISTILTYYPLRDAISILILLLSLPPTLVLVIQTLFASLTFVPPTAGISLSSLPNIKEMFNSSGLGYPALATILTVDFVFWGCWMPMWKPVKSIFLDLSQAVIAVSLSGAAASSGGPTYSIASTTIIVCIVHVLRYKAIHLTALDHLRSVLHKLDIGGHIDVPTVATNFISSPPVDRGWTYTVVRTMLGIHIVSQGVTTCIRRSLVKANEQTANPPNIARLDPEAVAGQDANARSTIGLAEAGHHAAPAPGTESRTPDSSAAHRENKSRESSSKKKRKQANQARSQQPLWAAIASTKVTFVKEMEQRNAADDAREVDNMHTSATTESSPAIKANTPGRVWVCDVRDTEIFLSVELSSEATAESVGKVEEGSNIGAGVDRSKPFYVRVNGAVWISTRIMLSDVEDKTGSAKGKCYEGEIFGLAPLSSYLCEVVGMSSGKVLCAASIITQPAPSADQAPSTSSQSAQQALRPSSPITTLKQSIQSAEARLHETRNRGKKSRKDQRAVHSDIKREISSLRTKLDSSGGTDDKQRQRLMQITQHKNQAEEATAEIKYKTDALGEIPEDEFAESEAKRRVWQAALDARTATNRDFEEAKAETDRELSALRSEISQAESKRERLMSRRSQRAQEIDKLVTKQHADMSAKQKRDFERAQVMQLREGEEQQLRFHADKFEVEAQGYQQKAHDAYQQISVLASWPSQQPPPYPGYSSPPTPETQIPALNGSLGNPSLPPPPPPPPAFPVFGPQPFDTSPFQSQPSIANPSGPPPRGRSSSMLSQYSGFTDNGVSEYTAPVSGPRQQHTWPPQPTLGSNAPMLVDDRKESEGSGSLTSGSTGSNSPRPEARPFVPSKASAPIGPPGRSKEKPGQSPLQTSATSYVVGSGK